MPTSNSMVWPATGLPRLRWEPQEDRLIGVDVWLPSKSVGVFQRGTKSKPCSRKRFLEEKTEWNILGAKANKQTNKKSTGKQNSNKRKSSIFLLLLIQEHNPTVAAVGRMIFERIWASLTSSRLWWLDDCVTASPKPQLCGVFSVCSGPRRSNGEPVTGSCVVDAGRKWSMQAD